MDTITPQQPHAISPPRTMHWMHAIRQYGKTLLVALSLFAVFSIFIYYSRGWMYDIRSANRAFADTAATFLGIVLLLGPLSRYFSFPDRYLQYRKELGIIACFIAIAHSVISVFFLPAKFSLPVFFAMFNAPFFFGLAATTLLVALFSISNDTAANAIGRQLWWKMQNWGVRIIFSFVFVHVFLMKWAGWVRWYSVGGGKVPHPELPSLGLLVGWFMAFVVLLRLAEFGGQRFFRIAWYVCAVALPALYIATFVWGMQFAK